MVAPLPPLPRPRPPRRRRRFLAGASAGPAAGGGVPGRVSPTRGLAGASRRGAGGGGAGSRPASSRACSAMSSSVSPRSASAEVQSSLPSIASGSSAGAPPFALPPFAARPSAAPVPDFLRPRPPRDPRRRRFFGAPSAVVPPDASLPVEPLSVAPLLVGSPAPGAGSFGSVVRVGDAAPAPPCSGCVGSSVGDSVSAPVSERSSSDIDAFSHDARASSARGRVSAASGSSRVPSRSIH